MRLETPRTILRDWEQGDLEPYRRWNTGEQTWMEFDGPYFPKMTAEELEEILERMSARIKTGDWATPRRRVAIIDKESGDLLGYAGQYWECEVSRWMSMGIVLFDPKTWGKGLAKEALRAWTGYLFEQDNTLVRLGFQTWSGNVGMIKVGQALGFREEARFRKARVVNGEHFDSVGMGVLREEWALI